MMQETWWSYSSEQIFKLIEWLVVYNKKYPELTAFAVVSNWSPFYGGLMMPYRLMIANISSEPMITYQELPR